MFQDTVNKCSHVSNKVNAHWMFIYLVMSFSFCFSFVSSHLMPGLLNWLLADVFLLYHEFQGLFVKLPANVEIGFILQWGRIFLNTVSHQNGIIYKVFGKCCPNLSKSTTHKGLIEGCDQYRPCGQICYCEIQNNAWEFRHGCKMSE